MMSLRKTVLSATIAMMLGPASFVWAAGPTETVQTAIQRVFTESSAPQARAGSTDDRRAHIREAAESLFDFREMARRSLG
jgi:ABC-type transporter MlaC component